MPTLIFEDMFGTTGTWPHKSASPTIVSTPDPPTGHRTLEINGQPEFVYWDVPDSGYVRLVFGVWLRFPAFPASSSRVFKIDMDTTEGWMTILSSGEPQARGDGSPTMAQVAFGSSLSTNTWYWVQLMADVSANPWQLQLRIGNTTVQTTGVAAASDLDNGNFMLGNTFGDAITIYYAHAKMGVAADDNDWWGTPLGFRPRELMTSRGTSW